MSLADIFQIKQEISINDKTYFLEYDNKAYAMLEINTGKGLYKLHDLLIVDNNLPFGDCIEVCCCGMLKHHTNDEIKEVRSFLNENIHALFQNNKEIVAAFINPMLPPDTLRKATEATIEAEKSVKKKK